MRSRFAIVPAGLFAAVAAFLPTEASGATVQYWAAGSSLSGGWVDPSQQGNNMCAPTTALTMIYWWQNQISEKYQLPSGVCREVHELTAYYSEAYNNTSQWIDTALKRYFTDKFDDGAELYSSVHDKYRSYGNDAAALSDYIRKNLEAGYICGLASGNPTTGVGSHACTLYGAEFDEDTGLMTKAWIADPSYYALNNALDVWAVSVNSDSNDLVFSQRYESSGEVVVSQFSLIQVDVLKHDVDLSDFLVPLIPEPSAFGLLAGAGVLAFAAVRRRRRK